MLFIRPSLKSQHMRAITRPSARKHGQAQIHLCSSIGSERTLARIPFCAIKRNHVLFPSDVCHMPGHRKGLRHRTQVLLAFMGSRHGLPHNCSPGWVIGWVVFTSDPHRHCVNV
eukprot:1206055-Amphidinium_carterae.1